MFENGKKQRNFKGVPRKLGKLGSWLDYRQRGESKMVKSLAESILSHKVDGLSSNNSSSRLHLLFADIQVFFLTSDGLILSYYDTFSRYNYSYK